MADLQRIQNQMNQLSSLIQEVEAMPESADVEPIKNKLLIWKSKTDAILEQEIDDYTREVEDFNRRWRMPMIGNTLKIAVIRKLRNAHTDLRLIIAGSSSVIAGLTGNLTSVTPDPLGHPRPRHSRLDRESLPTTAITDYAKALYNL